ncbi:MAG TPA: hypothetical protein VK281_17515 [Xanthobacteraceae bacterium]|nr:hypothetical protein [Xanthobacteraceae bacterium]
MPSLDFKGAFSTAPTSGMLEAKSEPPGAEAKASTGPICRTPCSLEVPASGEFTVTFSLAGYKSQTITVRPLPADSNAPDNGPNTVRYDPSPVFAQLEALTPPKGKRKSPKPAESSTTLRPSAANEPAAVGAR